MLRFAPISSASRSISSEGIVCSAYLWQRSVQNDRFERKQKQRQLDDFVNPKCIADSSLGAHSHHSVGAIHKIGLSAKLAADFLAFLIQFIELSRQVATMSCVGRIHCASVR